MRELYRVVPHLRERSGRSDIGITVASLTGLARIEGPRRQLVSFFRDASRVRVKGKMLVRAIAPRDRAGALRAAAAGHGEGPDASGRAGGVISSGRKPSR